MSEESSAPVEASTPVESSEPSSVSEVSSESSEPKLGAYDQFLADHAAQEAEYAREKSESEESSEEVEESVDVEPLYELTVDGESYKLTLEELQRGYNTNTVSNKRFSEAAQQVKAAKELEIKTAEWRDRLLNNPYHALQEAGVPNDSIRQHYEDVVYQWLQIDQMSDEERNSYNKKREYDDMQVKYAKMQEEMKLQQTKKEQEEFQKTVSVEQKRLTAEITDAISRGGLSISAESVRAIATQLKTAIESGYELSLDDAVALYKEDTNSSLKNMISSLPEDALMKLIGQDRMKNIRKMDIDKLKNPALPNTSKPVNASNKEERKSASSFFDDLKRSTYKS